ncbi:MAG: hypothetical protein LBG84_00995 [Treponema sp.]|jgi:hypothetical protein|nr:hypothetical protein [Treponema sp.]
MDFTKLRLVSPLRYQPFAGLSSGLFTETLNRREDSGETLFCFELNPALAFSIEPNDAAYLGPLLAAGSAVNGGIIDQGAAALVLPAGGYFFTQIRSNGRRNAGETAALCTEMAMELQKEGLWRRLKLGKIVYFRILWEDGARVFQALRPLTV